jgi:thioredoxin 1
MNAHPVHPQLAEVGEANFESEVLRSPRPTLVAFRAPWSRPCQVLDVALEEVTSACADTVKLVKVNADDNPDLSLVYDIQSIPTLIFFVEGLPCAKIVGTASKDAILAKLQAALNRFAASAPASEARP